jgi:excisionase family DNA binding protein
VPDLALLTVADVSARLKVSADQILAFIKSGQLRATNIGMGTRRPRWRIDPEALDQFLAARTATTKRVVAGRRQRATGDVIEFF